MKLAIKASIFSAGIGTLLLVIIALPTYGIVSLGFGLVMLPVAFVASLILSVPLIKLRQKIKEPYYFIIFLLVGFIGGILVVNLTFQKAIIDPWLIFTYGPVGAACSISAWFYIYKWGGNCQNT